MARPDALWPHVHLLTVLAETSSFTQTAQRLALSKAAVSQRLSELERAVGVPLVQRTTRSVRLTEAGRRLADETAGAFEQITHSIGGVRDLVDQPRGLVRLTAPVALGRQQVAPSLEGFFKRYPEVRIELELSDRLLNLAHEGFDLAVRHTFAPPDNHVAWKLRDSRTLLVASAGYLRRRGTPVHPSDLATHACLGYLRPGPMVWRFEAAEARTGEPDPQRISIGVQGPLCANNSEVLRDAVLAGLGIAQVPDFSAASALRAGRLREVLPDWRPVGYFGDAIYAMRPWSPIIPRAVRVLVEHLQAEFSSGPAA